MLTPGLADLLLATWDSVCDCRQRQDVQDMWLSHKKLPAGLCELLCWWWRDAPASPSLCHALSWLTFLVNTAVSQRPLCKIVFQFRLNFYQVIVWVCISVSLFLAALFVLVFWSIEDAFYSPFRPQVLASGCLLVQNVLVRSVCTAPVNSGASRILSWKLCSSGLSQNLTEGPWVG